LLGVPVTQTLKAIAVAPNFSRSAVASATYTISDAATPVAPPVFSPPGGTYTTPQSVRISDATQGAVIFFTTDGSTPTTSSPVYTGPINVAATGVLRAVAVKDQRAPSVVVTAHYTINGGH